MSEPLLLVVLPSDRGVLAPVVRALGGVPVIDLTTGAVAEVPADAWVRARWGAAVPGTGPVVLVDGEGPLPGRPTWVERVRMDEVPEGCAGVILRGSEVGGPCGERPGLSLLADVPAGASVILDAACSPEEAADAVARGAVGVVLSDVLLATAELDLPPRLASALARAGDETSRRIAGVRLEASPVAPVVRRILSGASVWDEADGVYLADDPDERAWLVGQGLALGRALAARHGGLAGVLTAYKAALSAGQALALAPAIQPALQRLVAAIAAALVPPAPPVRVVEVAAPAPAATVDVAPLPDVVCTGLSVGLPGGREVFGEGNLEALVSGGSRLTPVPAELLSRLLAGDAHGARSYGPRARLEVAADYGLPPAWVGALDVSAQLAVAAGLEALRAAGLPLVAERETPAGLALPGPLRARTGVVFASALPGLIRLLLSRGEAGALALAEGHSAFATLIGAAGPVASLNMGTSSTAGALALAWDWIRAGRADRVVVLGADDPTDEVVLESLAAGLLQADRPPAVGAVGFVLERATSATARGWPALARLARAELGLGASADGAGLRVGEGGRSARGRLGWSQGASLDDALAVQLIAAGRAPDAAAWDGAVVQACSQGSGGQRAVLTWERPEDTHVGDPLQWLSGLVGWPRPHLTVERRVLIARESRAPSTPAPAPTPATAVPPSGPAPAVPPSGPALTPAPPHDPPRAVLPPTDDDQPSASLSAWRRARKARRAAHDVRRGGDLASDARGRMLQTLTELVADALRLSPEAILPELHLGADLGLSLEQQTAVLDAICARYSLDVDPDDGLAEDPSVDRLAGWLIEEAQAVWKESPEAPAAIKRLFAIQDLPEPAPPSDDVHLLRVRPSATPTSTANPAAPGDNVQRRLLELVAEASGYRVQELAPDMELQGDLGLDAPTLVRLMAAIEATFGVKDDRFRLDDHPSVDALARWVHARRAAISEAPAAAPARPSAGPPPGIPQASDHLALGVGQQTSRADLPPSVRVRRPVLVPRPLATVGSLRGRVVLVAGEGPGADLLRAELSARGAKATGTPDAVVDWTRDAVAAFELAHGLPQPPRTWLCLTRLGRAPADLGAAATAGGRAGLARSLGRAWSGCQARVLDLAPELDPLEATRLICEELAASDPAPEIFRSLEPRRTLALRVEDFPPRAGARADRPVIAIIGGTRGVGAAIALELARRASARLVLIARTPPARKPYDEAAARAAVERALKARGRRPSDARVQRGLEPYRLSEEARVAVQRMRDAGAEVLFLKADLVDPASVQRALTEATGTLGRLDGAVLAVGNEEPRAWSERSVQGFAADYALRAAGGLAVVDALPPEAWFLSVGALSGRFGQAGQPEASASNEALARVCQARARALHVSLAALAEGGSVEAPAGADLVPLDGAASLLVDLIGGGASGELVLSGRLGEGTLACPHPFLDAVDVEGDAAEVRATLSADEEPWLGDYAVDGVSMLPLAMALELMAVAAQVADPARGFAGAEALKVHAPLSLPAGESVRIVVRAEPLSDTALRCALYSNKAAEGGRQVRTLHVSGVVHLGTRADPSMLPPAFFPEESIPRSQIYRRFFQGSTFQVLRDAIAVAAEGLLANAVVEHAMVAGDLLSAPLVLEAAFQGAALHTMAVDNVATLPSAVDGVWLVASPPDGDPLELMVQRVGDRYDVDVDGPEGAVLRVRGLLLADLGELDPADRFLEPEGGWPSAVVGLRMKTP